MGDRLIIFTRYPEPGKTKTRLIPALGVQGAANLQRQMTEFTVNLARDSTSSIAVYFAGGNQSLMGNWLGKDLHYFPQSTGDLGCRMQSAFADAFNSGFSQVIMIGVDCPELNSSLLKDAFQALKNRDLVLGPATDGGYYLIGMKQLIPELFIGIHWGTSEVLAMTQNQIKKLQLNCHYLPKLSDIDRPEDLLLWYQYSR